ncbi:MAG: M1 family metallopeptidase [Bacteroidetes bacterium]|nr:M1 family metallopeptidase [Bacteroidota bacterium]
MRKWLLSFFSVFFLLVQNGKAQSKVARFSHADTLRGSVTPERAWWDVLRYDIEVRPNYLSKTIQGKNAIRFRAQSKGSVMQIDLQPPLLIDSVIQNKKQIRFKKVDTNVWYVFIDKSKKSKNLEKDLVDTIALYESITIYYHGKPREAVRPPWDGGWIFTKDKLGRPWMSVACQGLGASVWYPCKDYQGDEPDSGASLTVIVPDTLVAVGNGRLQWKKVNKDGTATFKWEVKDPINNYDIIPYIGKYVTWHEDYNGEKGKLDCDFWVLDYDLEKAKKQFVQVDSMLHCFEYWMGPYPFYEDGYKLVEAPHLGMEHQSAVAYGNGFENGYRGTDLSGTGWGLKWDFIIVHESGHEWFGNNITTKDLADMWVHEGFTNYSETLYTDCQDGIEAGNDYCIGTRKRIQNDRPIIAHYGVNEEGSGDMYYKGGNMLHMIRQIINNDPLFRAIWRGLNRDFYHQTVTGKQIEEYISAHAHIDFSKVFDQYLRTTQIPILEYKVKGQTIAYRWANCVSGFNMPLKIDIGKTAWISPSETWKEIRADNDQDASSFRVDRNFYIHTKKLD